MEMFSYSPMLEFISGIIAIIVIFGGSYLLVNYTVGKILDNDWIYSGYGGVKGYSEMVEKGYIVADEEGKKTIKKFRKITG